MPSISGLTGDVQLIFEVSGAFAQPGGGVPPGFVTYQGATADVNLGDYSLTAYHISAVSLSVGTGTVYIDNSGVTANTVSALSISSQTISAGNTRFNNIFVNDSLSAIGSITSGLLAVTNTNGTVYFLMSADNVTTLLQSNSNLLNIQSNNTVNLSASFVNVNGQSFSSDEGKSLFLRYFGGGLIGTSDGDLNFSPNTNLVGLTNLYASGSITALSISTVSLTANSISSIGGVSGGNVRWLNEVTHGSISAGSTLSAGSTRFNSIISDGSISAQTLSSGAALHSSISAQSGIWLGGSLSALGSISGGGISGGASRFNSIISDSSISGITVSGGNIRVTNLVFADGSIQTQASTGGTGGGGGVPYQGATANVNLGTWSLTAGTISAGTAIGGETGKILGRMRLSADANWWTRVDSTASDPPVLFPQKARGSFASPVGVSANDGLFAIHGQGWDGSNFNTGARIEMFVDGVTATGVIPGRIEITSYSGATANTKLMVSVSGVHVLSGNLSAVSLSTNVAKVGSVSFNDGTSMSTAPNSGGVPYIGASAGVNLAVQSLTAGSLSALSITSQSSISAWTTLSAGDSRVQSLVTNNSISAGSTLSAGATRFNSVLADGSISSSTLSAGSVAVTTLSANNGIWSGGTLSASSISAIGGLSGGQVRTQDLVSNNSISAIGGVSGSNVRWQNEVVNSSISAIGTLSAGSVAIQTLSSNAGGYFGGSLSASSISSIGGLSGGQVRGQDIVSNNSISGITVSGGAANFNSTSGVTLSALAVRVGTYWFNDGTNMSTVPTGGGGGVPYTGATANVNLGTWSLTAGTISANSIQTDGSISSQTLSSGATRFNSVLADGSISSSTLSAGAMAVNTISANNGIWSGGALSASSISSVGGLSGGQVRTQDLVSNNSISAIAGVSGNNGKFVSLIVGKVTDTTYLFQSSTPAATLAVSATNSNAAIASTGAVYTLGTDAGFLAGDRTYQPAASGFLFYGSVNTFNFFSMRDGKNLFTLSATTLSSSAAGNLSANDTRLNSLVTNNSISAGSSLSAGAGQFNSLSSTNGFWAGQSISSGGSISAGTNISANLGVFTSVTSSTVCASNIFALSNSTVPTNLGTITGSGTSLVQIFVQRFAGYPVLATTNARLDAEYLQNALWSENIMMFGPTAPGHYAGGAGVTGLNSIWATSGGTVSNAIPLSSTNLLSSVKRARFNALGSSNSAGVGGPLVAAGISGASGTQVWRGTTFVAGQGTATISAGGFFFAIQFANNSSSATSQVGTGCQQKCFIGLGSGTSIGVFTTTAASNALSTMGNIIGIGYEIGSSTAEGWSFYCNSNTGFYRSIGFLPNRDPMTAVYNFYLYAPGGTNFIGVQLDSVSDNRTITAFEISQGATGGGLPQQTTFLVPMAIIAGTSGGVSLANAAPVTSDTRNVLDISRIYLSSEP